MKMKNILGILLMLSAVLVLLSSVGTAYATESVEIRSEVLEYYPAFHVMEGGYISANQWAVLYYDVKNTVHTEEIYFASVKVGWDEGPDYDEDQPLAPGHIGIIYVTEPVFQKFEYDWSISIQKEIPDEPPKPQLAEEISVMSSGSLMTEEISVPAGFAVLGFFGEPYVALSGDQITGYHIDDYSYFVEGYDDYKANKIAPLVMNDDSKFTLKTGESLDLGEGYTLFIDQIDIEGNKVHLILMKDGKELETSIVNTEASKDWVLKTTVLGDKDRQVLRVHVENVFQGSKDALVTIDGLWLIDYLNALEVKSDVDYGKWEAAHISSESLAYVAKDVALSSNSVIPLGKDWNIRVQDGFEVPVNMLDEVDEYDEVIDLFYDIPDEISDETDESKYNNRFYFFKEYTAPGKYDIRSSVSESADFSQTARQGSAKYILPYPATPEMSLPGGVYTSWNFAAFYYDIDADLSTEVLIAVPQSNYGGSQVFLKEHSSFMYLTTSVHTDYEYSPDAGTDENDNLINSWDSGYDVMGYFGEKYIPLNVVDAEGFHVHSRSKLEKFAPLVTDDDTKYTLKTGDSLELGNGYSLTVNQIDLNGNKADLALYKDNVFVTSSIVSTSSSGGSGNWIYTDTVLNIKNVQLMRVHVKDVFNGGKTNLVEIDAVWLTDFKNVTELNEEDEVGLMKYAGLAPCGNTELSRSSLSLPGLPEPENVLVFYLKNNLAMTDGMNVVIAEEMSLKAYEIESISNPLQMLSPRMKSVDNSNYKYYFYVTKEIANTSSGDDNAGGENNGGNGNNGNNNGDGSGDGSGSGDGAGSSNTGAAHIITDDEISKFSIPTGANALLAYFSFLILLLLLVLLYLGYKARKKIQS